MSIFNTGDWGLGKKKPTPANQTPEYWRQQVAGQAARYGRQADAYQTQSSAADRAWQDSLARTKRYYDQPGLNSQEQAGVGSQIASSAWDAEQARSNAAATFGRTGGAVGSDYQGAVQGTTNAQMLAAALARRQAEQLAADRQQRGADIIPALSQQYAQAMLQRLVGAQGGQSDLLSQLVASYLQQQQIQAQQKQSDLGLLGNLAGAAATIFARGKK
ncbi:MAG TPA: hypothetical protein PK308_05305 [Phycisphaerales bacterium]|nr:hypothetical protein [Phycisphaerales bacterium]